jgi:prefoldin subunit 5
MNAGQIATLVSVLISLAIGIGTASYLVKSAGSLEARVKEGLAALAAQIEKLSGRVEELAREVHEIDRRLYRIEIDHGHNHPGGGGGNGVPVPVPNYSSGPVGPR